MKKPETFWMPTVSLDFTLNDPRIPNPCTHSWILQFAIQIERAKLQKKRKKNGSSLWSLCYQS